MSLMEMFGFAISSLLVNKLRSILTMLGIFIGVASILAIMAIGSGGTKAIVSTLESARLQETIQIIPTEVLSPGIPQPGQVLNFTQSDFNLARQFSGVENVYYTLYGQATIGAASQTVNASVEAGPDFLDEIGHFAVVSGRMFTSTDVIAHRRVALLSESLAQKLFPKQSPLNQLVMVGNQPLRVIGITISTQGNLLSGIMGSDYLYMPSTTCLDIFPWWTISEMDVQAKQGVNKADLAKKIVMALNIHAHSAEAFETSSGLLLGIEKTVGTVTRILTLIIGSVAGIALVVGGVGVMNIMLVAVSERTAEIGIRMSLGATRRDILTQFLLESATITLVGGGFGVMAGLAFALALHLVTGFPVGVSWWSVVVSVLFSVLIGILCGLYPANKAAHLNPVDALRHE